MVSKKLYVTIVCVIIIAVFTYYFFGTQTITSVPSTVKVGVIESLSGNLASVGIRHRIEHEDAVQIINKGGGIYIDAYKRQLPIELILLDDQSSPQYGAEIASKLILDYKVDILITGSYAHISGPIAKIAENNGVPTLIGTPIEFIEAQGPWKFVWCYFFSYGKIIDGFVNYLSKFEAKTNKRVGIVLSDDVIGRTQQEMLVQKLSKAGYTIINTGLYPPGTIDFTSVITKLISEECEILWVHATPPIFSTFWRQCKAFNYKPKIAYVSGGLGLPDDAKYLGGDLALGLLSYRAWHPSYPFPYVDYLNQVRENYKKSLNLDLGYSIGYYFAIWLTIKDSIERAGALDKEAVNEAIANSHLEGPCGPVFFNSETHTGSGVVLIGQWMKTSEGEWELVPVWSEVQQVPLTTPIFPLP